MKCKYITFTETPSTGKTKRFNIVSNSSGIVLGIIKWYAPWRSYCFFPSKDTLFNEGCIVDIAAFTRALMLARKPKEGVGDE